MKMKKWNLTIRIKRNDELGDKKIQTLLMEFLKKSGVAGATVWTGVDGFGKRGNSTMHLEGVAVNMPLIIEVIDDESKLSPYSLNLKE
jgi:uncharacterized protein